MNHMEMNTRPIGAPRVNREVVAGAGVRNGEGSRKPEADKKKSSSKLIRIIGVVMAVAMVIAVAVYYFVLRPGAMIDSGYQAVFLGNGQVYFGKLQVLNGSYLKITNVYYIQSNSGMTAADATDANNIELVRLTKAVHGPKDEIVINRDQVLYFENLDDEGQAAKLISGDKDSK